MIAGADQNSSPADSRSIIVLTVRNAFLPNTNDRRSTQIWINAITMTSDSQDEQSQMKMKLTHTDLGRSEDGSVACYAMNVLHTALERKWHQSLFMVAEPTMLAPLVHSSDENHVTSCIVLSMLVSVFMLLHGLRCCR